MAAQGRAKRSSANEASFEEAKSRRSQNLGKLERWASSQIGVAETDAKMRGRARENFMVSKIWVLLSLLSFRERSPKGVQSPLLFHSFTTVSPFINLSPMLSTFSLRCIPLRPISFSVVCSSSVAASFFPGVENVNNADGAELINSLIEKVSRL